MTHAQASRNDNQNDQKQSLKVYRDEDCNLDRLTDKTIAVIGYGAQGHAHALNLKDSGLGVIVALPEHSKTKQKAQDDGFDVLSVVQAAQKADIVMMLAPDEWQADIYKDALEKHMKPGATLMFAHGLNIHFDLIKPRSDLDISMVAPKGAGYAVRAEYQKGAGIACLVAVAQNASGKAFDTALAYASAIGGGRTAIIETSFKDECETDLFGEQAVLCGGVAQLVTAGYETLVEAGYPEEMAYIECLHELKLVVDLIHEKGISGMQESISNTAEYGGYVSGSRIINQDAKKEMQGVLDDIQSGAFVQKFIGGNKEGLSKLADMRAQKASHVIEETGERLRGLLSSHRAR